LLAGDKFVGTPTDQPPAAKRAMIQEEKNISVHSSHIQGTFGFYFYDKSLRQYKQWIIAIAWNEQN
jgi:hypothetical protein